MGKVSKLDIAFFILCLTSGPLGIIIAILLLHEHLNWKFIATAILLVGLFGLFFDL